MEKQTAISSYFASSIECHRDIMVQIEKFVYDISDSEGAISLMHMSIFHGMSEDTRRYVGTIGIAPASGFTPDLFKAELIYRGFVFVKSNVHEFGGDSKLAFYTDYYSHPNYPLIDFSYCVIK